MGSTEPVIFIPIEQLPSSDHLEHWNSALFLIPEPAIEDFPRSAPAYCLRMTSSRNWWHQYALARICQGLEIKGMEFINSEVACLDRPQLELAIEALEQLMTIFAIGLPNLGVCECYAIEFLRYPKHQDAFVQAQAVYKLDIQEDCSSIGFYCFVKTMRQAIVEAMEQNKYLLYIQPQP